MNKFIIFLCSICLATTVLAKTGQVSEYTLTNGLKILIKEDHRAPVVVSQIWYKVGSSFEPKGETGISHLLEHMMFRGTTKYGPGSLKKIIAEEGGDINAQTAYDYTMYYEVLAADKLPISLKLEADRMRGLLLNQTALQDERQIVLEEWRTRLQDSPQARTFERFMAVAHVASPYRHMPIGWHIDIENITSKNLRNWYRQWYAPNNAILVIVGDVNPQNVYQLVQKYFGKLTPSSLPQAKPHPEIFPIGERTLTVRLPAKLPWLLLGYNVPSLKTANNKADAYTLDIIEAILSGGESARIPKTIIRKQQIAMNAWAYYKMYARYDEIFLLGGTPNLEYSVQQLQKAFLQQINVLKTKLVPQQELQKIKTQIITARIYAKDSMTYQATEMGKLEAIGLPWQVAQDYVKNIDSITPEKIQAVARKYFVPSRLTIGILYPKKTNKSGDIDASL